MEQQDKPKKEIKLPENVAMDFTFERTLKSFLKQIQKEGKMQELKDRRYYTKPSEIKRRLENERRRKNHTGKNQKRRKNQ
jgi:ribosomal protein S21